VSAPTVVQSAASFIGATTPTSIAVSMGSPTTVGDTLLLSLQCFNSAGASAADLSVTDDGGNTYTTVDFQRVSGALAYAIYKCEDATSSATAITVTISDPTYWPFGMENATLIATELASAAGFYPTVDQYAAAYEPGAGGTTITFPSVTTASLDELVLAHALVLLSPASGSTPFTAGAGYAMSVQLEAASSGFANYYGACEYGSAPTPGTYTPSLTFSGGGTAWSGITLTLSLASTASGPPPSEGPLYVDLTESLGELQSWSSAQQSLLVPIAVIDGGTYTPYTPSGTPYEVVAYETVELEASNKYKLDPVITRGLLGTAAADHPIGSVFIDLSNPNTVFKTTIPNGTYAGQTLHFKFPSFNIWGSGLQDLSDCVDYTYTVI